MLKDIILLIPTKKIYTDNLYNINLFIDYKYLNIVLMFLKKYQMLRLNLLSTISCSDFPELINRFELTYILLSLDYSVYINIKCKVSEINQIESISFLYKSAVWLEREIWDMFGVYFINNYDLRRLLTDYGFPFHPLRKTFPLQGYFQINYNYIKKKILYIPNGFSLVKPFKNILTHWNKVF